MKREILEEWTQISASARPKIRYWLPAAAVDKEDLYQEMVQLKERGFGGVEIVTLENIPEEIACSEEGWGTAQWDDIVFFILETAKELGMTVDLANGPGWPISMPAIKDADDPAALCELTYGVMSFAGGYYCGQLPERRITHEEGTPKLVHVLAYLEVGEKILKQESYVDLREFVQENTGMLECYLPEAPKDSRWLIFAFYSQPAVHKVGHDQFYVINHLSKNGVKDCEIYWDSVMSHFPEEVPLESIFCDSLEYRVMMDWTPELPDEFMNRRGYSILPYLPVIGLEILFPVSDVPGYQFDDASVSDMINNDYLETLTQCYCEYHLEELEHMACKYGKSIRYQVAYNKPFEGERCPLYVQIPENEALGRPAIDYQKIMASAAHLGRKKRYSFECAAEFGNGYGQTYDDLLWWVKRSLTAGMNAQVFHGASYSGRYCGKYSINGFMDGVKWPGYEGFGKGCSNYWNRTLSIEDAKGVLDTIARMNTIFLKKAKVDCAIYRESYSNDGLGSEFCFYPDNGKLVNRGYSYETISPFLLDLPVCRVSGKLLDPDGVGYQCMIVPYQEAVSKSFLIKAEQLLENGFKIIWIGDAPVHSLYYGEWKTPDQREIWRKIRDRVWNNPKLSHVSHIQDVPDTLLALGIVPRIGLDGTADIMTTTHVDEERHIKFFSLYAYNRVECTPEDPNPEEFSCSALYKKGTTKSSYHRPGEISRKTVSVKIHGMGKVYLCNPWNGRKTLLNFRYMDGYMEGNISIEEDEMILLAVFEDEIPETKLENDSGESDCLERKIPVSFHTLELQEFVPDTKEEKSFLRSHFSKEKQRYSLSRLIPWNKLDTRLEKFGGKGIYYGTVTLKEKRPGMQYIFHLGNVQDTFHVFINGESTEFPDQVLKRLDITDHLHEGENKITVEVFSNLYNKLQGSEDDSFMPIKIPYVEKNYGIWEDDSNRCMIYERGIL